MSIKKEFQKMEESVTNPLDAVLNEVVLEPAKTWWGGVKKGKDGNPMLRVVPGTETPSRKDEYDEHLKQSKLRQQEDQAREAAMTPTQREAKQETLGIGDRLPTEPVQLPGTLIDQGALWNAFNSADQKEKQEFIAGLIDLIFTKTGNKTRAWFVARVNKHLQGK